MKIKSLLILAASCLLAACASNNENASSEAPLIGITPYYSGNNSTGDISYINAVRKAGGVPVVLPGAKTKEEAEALIDAIDGIIFTGGEDVDPARYGEEILNESVYINAVRDTSDFLMAQAAFDRKIPIIGICRGSQLLNVFLGGTLWQDIPTQKGGEHRQSIPCTTATHTAGLEKGSRIRELLADADSVWVNTSHHQAVKDIAPGCKVTARAADGIVEAWEGPGVFCTQFHPEALILGGDMTFLPIFRNFVEECRY